MAEDSLDHADPLDPVDVAAAAGSARETVEKQVTEAQAVLRTRREAYVRVFSDKPIAGDAAIVLADLKRFCRGNQTPWDADARYHALLTGRFEVYNRVSQHTTMGFDDLWVLYSGSEES